MRRLNINARDRLAALVLVIAGTVALAQRQAVNQARALWQTKRWVRSVKTEKHDWTSPYHWTPMVLIGRP